MSEFDLPMPEGLTFDDVLLVPGYADFHADEADLGTRLTARLELNVPLVSAAMDSVTEAAMAVGLARLGGMGIIHRNATVERQAEMVAQAKAAGPFAVEEYPLATRDARGRPLVGAAVGAAGAVERARALLAAGADLIVLDTPHGHAKPVLDALRALKAEFPDAQVMVGNIATAEAARDLIAAGADGLKVGIGAGAAGTTRVVAGVGVPQLSAIRAVASAARPAGVPIVADGGIRYSGDLTKAIAAGADAVMIGSLFARTHEAPGLEINFNGRAHKLFRGMGAGDGVAEGTEGLVPLSGAVDDAAFQLLGGLTKGMHYCGARSIPSLQAGARFIRVSPAAVREGQPVVAARPV